MSEEPHISVMPRQALELLRLPLGGVAVDGTLGLAGHAVRIAEVLGAGGHLIGIDRDSASLAFAKKRLASLDLRVDLLQGSFSGINHLLADVKVSAVDGILLDLGISSFQLDDSKRGFAFKVDGPLDMRMDQNAPLLAADIVNTYKKDQLEKIIAEYGEERFSRRIAEAIVARRCETKITGTKELSDIILRALPRGYTRGRIHPATRTFQALRIAVNQELNVLEKGIDLCFQALKTGGRLCIISFHSLEDRIVKNKFKQLALDGHGDILTKKPWIPDEEECELNPRSRSAKMRAIERIL